MPIEPGFIELTDKARTLLQISTFTPTMLDTAPQNDTAMQYITTHTPYLHSLHICIHHPLHIVIIKPHALTLAIALSMRETVAPPPVQLLPSTHLPHHCPVGWHWADTSSAVVNTVSTNCMPCARMCRWNFLHAFADADFAVGPVFAGA